MAADEPLPMGRLGAVYGLKGQLKVISFTEQPENLFGYKPWFIRQRGGEWQEVEVEDYRPHGKGFVVKLKAVEVPEEARRLTGADIGIRRSSLPPAPPGLVYLRDLVGLQVIGIGGVSLGTVSSVVDHGASPILVVAPSDHPKAGEPERLIPFVRGPIVKEVSLDLGIIRVEWGEDY